LRSERGSPTPSPTPRTSACSPARTASASSFASPRTAAGSSLTAPAPRQHVYRILDAGEPAGTLWIGVVPGGLAEHWWVWSIEIDEPLRGRGLGRQAMAAAEARAREHGATQLGLNVFAHNTAAWRLYESLGYAVSSADMRKQL
jgi:ribosomal protein S18 acetylase RimI-like enzyme